MSNNSTIKVLPSEAAQSLAQYLKCNQNDFLDFGYQGYATVNRDDLAQAIQDYWDSLP